MSSYNKVILIGNLTRDVELTFPGEGKALGQFRLAVNEGYKNKAGEKVEEVCFVDVTVWGKQAESCAEYIEKGRLVLVEGKLKLDQWTNKEGEKRSKLKVVASQVQFLGNKT